jgi:hypothetical protein
MSEALEAVARAAQYGAPPPPPVREEPGVSRPKTPEGIFSAADLYYFSPQPVAYRMPNKKAVWVHPCSDEEIAWLTLQSFREMRQVVIEDEAAKEFERRRRAQVYQVICCARTGEEPDAPQVFKPEDAAALRRNRGWWRAVREICARSDALGTDDETLSEDLRDFFDGLRQWAETLSSASNGSVPGALAQFGSFVSAIKQRGTLSPSDRDTLLSLTQT